MSKIIIREICKKYGIKNYTINDDMSIDVNGNVYIDCKELTSMPLRFNKVSGWFDCSSNNLTSLEGSPKEIHGEHFSCNHNKLTNLNHLPFVSKGNIFIYGNPLPRKIYDAFKEIINIQKRNYKLNKILYE